MGLTDKELSKILKDQAKLSGVSTGGVKAPPLGKKPMAKKAKSSTKTGTTAKGSAKAEAQIDKLITEVISKDGKPDATRADTDKNIEFTEFESNAAALIEDKSKKGAGKKRGAKKDEKE